MFHILGSKDDVIKQDLVTHGLSLFDHFDIKYVTLHKELPSYDKINQNTLSLRFLPETKQHMSEILGGYKPIYEDNHIIVYKIPKSNSLEPFLLLGSGWHIFEIVHDVRTVMKNSELQSQIQYTLQLLMIVMIALEVAIPPNPYAEKILIIGFLVIALKYSSPDQFMFLIMFWYLR